MANALYITVTLDEMKDDFKNLSDKELDYKYKGNVIRVLQRPKNWKEELYNEYSPNKMYYLCRKYNMKPYRVKQIYNEVANKKYKELNS